jgi:hypothetical protein
LKFLLSFVSWASTDTFFSLELMSTARHIEFLVNRMYLGKSRGLATQGKRYNNKEADSICYYTLEGEVATGARIYLVQTQELKIDFHL